MELLTIWRTVSQPLVHVAKVTPPSSFSPRNANTRTGMGIGTGCAPLQKINKIYKSIEATAAARPQFFTLRDERATR